MRLGAQLQQAIGQPKALARLGAESRGSTFPGAFNLQSSWLAQLKAGYATRDHVLVGDSTARGFYAGTGAAGKIDLFNHSIMAELARLQAARGYTTRGDAWHGDGAGTTGLIADFQIQNANNSVGASWAILTSPAEAAGGALLRDNSGTSTMALTADNCDSFLIEYRRATGSASIQIDSETALTYDMATVTNFTLTSGIQQLIRVSGGGVGTHTLKITRISGDVQILGVEPRRSAGGEKRFINLGRGGNTSGLAANSATATSPLTSLKTLIQQRTAPLVMVNLGINDQNQSVTTTDYKTAMQTVIDAIVSGGGIPLLVGSYATSTTPSAAYITARRELAVSNGIPLFDLLYYFPTWARIQAAGYNFDGSSHLNASGYAAVAVPLDTFLAWAVR